MKKFFFYLIAAVAVCCMTACGSDDNGDEPGKVELTNGQTNKVDCWSNTTSGQITFSAPAGWTATVEAVSRAGADWLHLDRTSGSAGDVTLTFTLDSNNTGASRSANIIITSGNSRVIITITQSPEDDPDGNDEPTPTTRTPSVKNVFVHGYCLQKNDWTTISYDQVTWQVTSMEIDGVEYVFRYGYQGCDVYIEPRHSVGNKEAKTYEIMLAENLPFAKTLKAYENGTLAYSYDFEYNPQGQMTRANGKVNDEFGVVLNNNTELTWQDGNVVKAVANSESISGSATDFVIEKSSTTATYTYADNQNLGCLLDYDDMWVGLGEEDDVAQMLHYTGLMGMAPKNLIKSWSAVQKDNEGTYRFNMSYTYTFDGLGLPAKQHGEGEEIQDSYHDTWSTSNSYLWLTIK